MQWYKLVLRTPLSTPAVQYLQGYNNAAAYTPRIVGAVAGIDREAVTVLRETTRNKDRVRLTTFQPRQKLAVCTQQA